MVIFQSIQKYLAILGIKSHPETTRHDFNLHNLMVTSVLGTASIASLLYLLEEPNFEEYVICAYASANAIVCTANLVIMICKSSEIFGFIEGLEFIIQMSELTLVDLVSI